MKSTRPLFFFFFFLNAPFLFFFPTFMNPPKTPDRPTVSPLAHQTFTPCTRLSRMTLGPATDDPPRPFQEGWMEEKVRGEERSLDKKRVRPSLGGSDGGLLMRYSHFRFLKRKNPTTTPSFHPILVHPPIRSRKRCGQPGHGQDNPCLRRKTRWMDTMIRVLLG